MRVLITGGTGFLGSFLAERLAARGDAVWVTAFGKSGIDLTHIPQITTVKCDVTSREQLLGIYEVSAPDRVFHLAAQTYIDQSWTDPATTFRTNVHGTLNLLEIGRQIRHQTTIVIACSSAEYGTYADLGKPLQEDSPLLPVSPYGLSKLGQDLIGYQYHRKYGVEIIRARIFNTIGPRKRGDFLADFCLKIVAMEQSGVGACLRVGNLDSERDLTDVRDMVAALDGLAQRGTSGQVYNLCSGRATRIRDVLDLLRVRSRVPFKACVDPALLRPHEEKIILGNNRRLVDCTGWAPSIPLSETVTDTLEYWRSEDAMRSVNNHG